MTADKQIETYKGIDEKILSITISKRNDYAMDENVLSNFESVSTAAKALGITVENATNYSLFMVLLKIARLSNLINSDKIPNNESIEDSFLDGINYFKLALCNYIDKKI